jgi:hypothetical protein
MLHADMAEFIFQDMKSGKKIDLQFTPEIAHQPVGNT